VEEPLILFGEPEHEKPENGRMLGFAEVHPFFWVLFRNGFGSFAGLYFIFLCRPDFQIQISGQCFGRLFPEKSTIY
jgi:hypothetical protein